MKSNNKTCSYKTIFFLLILLFNSFPFSQKLINAEEKKINIRKPAVAGSFYPDNPLELTNMINSYLSSAKLPNLSLKPKILISPHAGYVFSGQVAAYGYKAIQKLPFTTVIILGPAHYEYLQGASIYSKGNFSTPLGQIEIDNELAIKILNENSLFTNNISSHTKEHSIETQLPFLQLVLKKFKIVPIIIGDIKRIEDFDLIAKAILKNINGRNDVLIVVSTDLSHYNNYAVANKMDDMAIDGILRIDSEFLLRKVMSRDCELCGFNPVMAAIEIAKLQNYKGILLNKANSGDTAGDKQRVVGYTSILLGEAIGDKKMEELTNSEKKELLEIAKKTIISYIKENSIPKFENITNQKFLAKQGAFVTIKKKHSLRGCIGTFTSDEPLYRTIIEMAVSSSSRDPRFQVLSIDELKDISIEISVLSELKRIKSVDEIKVGTHGIYIIRGYYRGVLLPQVATEYGWDRNTFLQQTCFKAGLPADAWKDPLTEIYIFSAQIFNEEDKL